MLACLAQPGHTQGQRKPQRLARLNVNADLGTKRIIGALIHAHWHATHHRLDMAWRVHCRGQSIVSRGHLKARCELGPALVEIGGAAAKVRIQAKQVGLRPVGSPRTTMQAALHLIALLVVLVRPHVVTEGAGQGVVGDGLQAVGQRGITEDGQRRFQ